MNRLQIIERLSQMHKKEGFIFTSEHDAVNYFKKLVDLIEECAENLEDKT